MSHFLSPKGGYYWSVADWNESIKALIVELPPESRAFYFQILEDVIITCPSELKSLYSKVQKKVLNHKFPM